MLAGVHSPNGSTFLREMTLRPPFWKYDVISRLRRLMRIPLRKNSAKFHPDPIWNEGALSFFTKKKHKYNKKTIWVATWDQVADPKNNLKQLSLYIKCRTPAITAVSHRCTLHMRLGLSIGRPAGRAPMTLIQCRRLVRTRSLDVVVPLASLELTRFHFDVYNRARL